MNVADVVEFPSKKPWRKLLWVDQPYPDNYTDASFLSQLKRNSNLQTYSYNTLASDASVILLHLGSVCIFGLVFLGIYNRGWNPVTFAMMSSIATILGFIIWDTRQVIVGSSNSSGSGSSNAPGNYKERLVTLKSSLFIVFTIMALSPVLKSLTQSTSSDSIWALSIWLCIANVCFYDYSFVPKKEFRPMLSTNLALCAAIVLASRLPTTLSVFCFVLFSIQLFGIFPTFALWVRTTSSSGNNGHWVLLAIVVVLSDTGLFIMGGIWALSAWLAVQLFVMGLLPGLLLAFQKYKNEIQGPWDPAKPVIRAR